MLTATGLGSDQSERVEVLAQALAAVPVRDATSIMGRAHLALTVALAWCAGFLAWLAHVRGRRLAWLRRPGGNVRGIAIQAEEAVVGRNVNSQHAGR